MTVLEASGITVSTQEGKRLLSDVTVSLHQGETVLLAGPSGSGKTLLGKVLGGILGRTSALHVTGSVTENGNVGYLFQNPMTQLVRRQVYRDVAFGLENKGIPRKEIEERVEKWADRVDAIHLLDRSIEELSRGETAVVALLGTLVSDPDIVILDEPLAPLDERNRQFVLDLLDEIRSGETTVLVAEHDSRDLFQRADRALLLVDGSIESRGKPHDLAKDLQSIGVRLPFDIQVDIEREAPGENSPLTERSDVT